MKKRIYSIIPALTFFATSAFSQNIEVIEQTYVSSVPEAQIIISVPFDSSTNIDTLKLNPAQYSLNNGNGEKVICTRIGIGKNMMEIFFHITPSNFSAFENLVTDSSGYFLDNKDVIRLNNSKTLQSGELCTITQNKIGKISDKKWKKYVLNEYSAQYLFPQIFEVGIDPNMLGTKTADSSQTVYYVHLVQSGNWVESMPMFWGVKARWSTGKEDKSNFVQLYPLTLLFNTGIYKLSLGTGIETGYLGFEKQGRATLKADARFRLPYNPVDLTLGFPRARIFPMISLSAQGNLGWANVSLPDSLKRGYDITAGIRYGIPVSKAYYIQLEGKANYASATKKIQTQYDVSLGYIANGSLRIAAAYEQGYQEVSYKFDQKLLISFVFDVLNAETVH
jgi:hypothetical protein